MTRDEKLAITIAASAAAAVGVVILFSRERERLCGPTGRADTAELFGGVPLEDYPPSSPVTKCDPTPKPGVLLFRDWVLSTNGGTDLGISRACDGPPTSRHHEGRAWDWGPPSDDEAELVLACLIAPDERGRPHALARRAGLRVIIWNRRIWTSGTKEWRKYSGASPHTDHVHFAFGWPGANAETSLYALLDGSDDDVGGELGELGEVASMLAVRGIENTNDAFREKVIAIGERLGRDPDLLMLVMSFETAGTFNPRITAGGADFDDNPNAAVGLIQWTKKYAPLVVGKTTAELAKMGAIEQLDYVEIWFKKGLGNRPDDSLRPVDYYLAVFGPSGIAKPDGFVIYPAGSNSANSNKGMQDASGNITVGSVRLKIDNFLAGAMKRPRVQVPSEPSGAGSPILAGTLTGLAAFAMAALLEWT